MNSSGARPAAIAFGPAAVLFALMTAHAILETARDALYLARLGAEQLAWAYLAIAGSALGVVTVMRRSTRLRDPRRLLFGSLLLSTMGTAVIAALITEVPSLVFVLYVWTGLIATLIVPSFWTVLDRAAHVAQAKRLFAVVGAGGALGAMTGSAVAAALGRLVPAHHLVTAGAIAFAAATVAARVLVPDYTGRPQARPVPEGAGARRPGRYLRWTIAIGTLSTVALTLGDLTFKRVVAERIDPGDLASTFGAIYTCLNLLSLLVQVAVTPRLLARFGVGGAMLVLPVIVVCSAGGFALTGAALAILALKLSDGGLRHSLHRVVSEILYLPVPSTVRDGAKPIADAIAQRGGQAAAALLVFAVGAAGAGSRALALLTAAVGLAWLAAARIVRALYVQQFRDSLRDGEIHRDVRVPEVDATSERLLVEALSSPDEAEALAALDLLGRRGGQIPALVLYHPHASVVRRALALLEGSDRRDVTNVLAHLLEHPDPRIRADALAAARTAERHRQRVVAAMEDPEPDVRAAALIALATDPEHEAAAGRGAAGLLRGSTAEQAALAHAIGLMPRPAHRALLGELLAAGEPAVQREALEVLTHAPELADPEQVLGLLADPYVRDGVRRVFLALGAPGLERLIVALGDPRTPLPVQRHLPRTISRFRTPRAAAALVDRLPREPDGTTEFKILRALGRMRGDDPTLPVDAAVLHAYARRAITDAARYATLGDRLAAEGTDRSTAGGSLLSDLLAEKRRHAIDHVFRALDILHPGAGLRSVHDAITSRDADRRAAAREVVEHMVRTDQRQPLLALVDDLPPAVRAARLGLLAAGPFDGYEAFLAALLADPSSSLRSVAAHHIAERRLTTLRADLTHLRAAGGSPLVIHAFDQALASLDG